MARSRSARAGGIQMTEGSLYKNILLFSVPLIFSQLLQVLFNMADVAVVGKFSSATALGSVGSTSTLVTLFTGFLIGLSNGVNVRVAQYLGARQEEDTRNCVHTALILCTLSGVVIAVLCFFLAAPMLELLKTKDDLLPGAVLYFRIYALGMPALGIFNFGNAVLSASGDTKRPLAYLTAAGILNVILNLFFVIVCKMAADGVALASIISQYLSAVLVLLHMTRLTDSCRVEWKLLRLHGSEVGRILGLGVPAGIQHMIFAVANLFTLENSTWPNPDGLLFPSKAGTHLDPKSFEIRLAAVSKRCEIRKVNPHALRHTLATRLVEDKVPLNIVQGILGHSSIETTRKYLHKNEDIEREAIGMMSDYLNMGQMDAAPRLNGAAPRAKFADVVLPTFPQRRNHTA